MIDNNSVLIMSEDTWEAVKEEEYKIANKQEDPIAYIMKLNELNIVIDNTLPFGITEVWDKPTYDKFKELEDDDLD